MSLVLSVPGKTFLAGEYLALSGGPTLVFASHPRFQLSVQNGSGKTSGLHPDSPAGKYIQKYAHYFSKFDLEFQEAYSGRGGFGASTAQFLSVYALNTWRDSAWLEPQQLFDFKNLLDAYFEVAWNGEGQRPSGADLIGQLRGALTLFEKSLGRVAQLSWPFADLDFVLVHTGNKVATHEHLKELKSFDASLLALAFDEIRWGLEQADSRKFLQGIQSYAESLQKLDFVCAPTLSLLQDLIRIPGVQAAKGCGALGADVVLVVFASGQDQQLKKYLQEKGLSLVIERSQMSTGLEVQVLKSQTLHTQDGSSL